MSKLKMSNLLIKFLVLGAIGIFVRPTGATAETIFLTNSNYVINGLPSGVNFVSLRFGTWNGTTFTQQVIDQLSHSGYAALPSAGDDFPDLQLSLNQTDNTVISSTTALALAVFSNGSANSGPLDYTPSNAAFQAIFTNPSWVAGTFSANTDERIFELNANTTAVIGSYLFSSGTATMTLIPEPSTSALMMIGAAGLVALRRLRKV